MAKGTLQTLERGIRVLELAAASPKGIAMPALAEALDVHRTIAYRLVSTLEASGLVTRPGDGRVYVGSAVLRLTANYLPQLRILAQPLLQQLSEQTQATAFLTIAEGNECAVVTVEEYREAVLQVGYRVGSRHPLNLGAAGIAILAGRPEHEEDAAGVHQARAQGYSYTQGEIQSGARGVASPVKVPGLEASIGIVSMSEIHVDVCALAVQDTAKALEIRLQGIA